MKITVRIKNILFGTMWYHIKLPFDVFAVPIYIFVVAWYQFPNIFVIESTRLCFQLIPYNGLWRISVLLASVSWGQRNENLWEPSQDCMVDDQTLLVQNAAGGSSLQLQCATAHCHEEGHDSYLVGDSTFRSMLCAPYVIRNDNCESTRSIGQLETLRKTFSHRPSGFSFPLATNRTLKNKKPSQHFWSRYKLFPFSILCNIVSIKVIRRFFRSKTL